MRAAAPQLLLALLALVLGVAFFVLDPSRSLRPDAALRLLSGLGGALTWGFAALGAGGALLSGVDPSLLEGRLGWLHALLAGLLAWGLLMLGMGAFGLLQPGPILGLGLLLGAGWLRCPALRLPRLSPALGLALVLVGLPGLIDALAPPIDTDELYYHLALPQQLLRAGGLVGGVLDPSGSRPLALHLPFAALLATAGPAAPKLFHLLLGLLLLLGLHELGRRELGDRAAALAVLLLAGSYSVVHDAGLGGQPAHRPGRAGRHRRGPARSGARPGPGGGLALGLKYTAAAAILGLFLVALEPSPALWPRARGPWPR